VEEEARNIQGKKALAVESLAEALRQIPTILADNAGLDSSDLVVQLRADHFSGKQDAGLGASPLHLASFRGAFC
jgi:T-complex protein 1 subunit beta